MSREYDLYLDEHKLNVRKGFDWIKENLPHLCEGYSNDDLEYQICYQHDASKSEPDEYEAYDKYFYGGNRSFKVVEDFRFAWLNHIHRNPHHWQYWVLINDDPNEGTIVLDMPHNYILEMVCDWWAFSWKKYNESDNIDDLGEIFKWHEAHKDYMKLSDKTRKTVNDILEAISGKLLELAQEKEEPNAQIIRVYW